MEENNGRKPAISVIMPVYKVEDCIREAAGSIIRQTFTDWELYLVDDGSPDNSGAICDELAAADERITVIHKENGGAPSARNEAIRQAGGRYFYFMDSDDTAEAGMLERMYSEITRTGAQLLVAGYYIDTYYSDGEYITQEIFDEAAVYDKEAFRKNAYRLFDRNLLYTPWNKLYDAEYIKERGLLFPDTLWDDFPFNLSVMRDIDRVCVIEERFYHFIRRRAESETAKYVETMYEKREEEHDWMEELYGYWGVTDEASIEFLARRYIERLVGCIENVTNERCTLDKVQAKEQIRRMISTDRTAWAIEKAKPRSKMMKMMLKPVANGNVGMCYAEGKFISRVKTGNVKLFSKLKAGR